MATLVASNGTAVVEVGPFSAGVPGLYQDKRNCFGKRTLCIGMEAMISGSLVLQTARPL